MSQPTPTVRWLARRVLECELEDTGNGRQRDSAAPAHAAQRAMERLPEPLGRLIGLEGYWALFRRAVHLARSESPLLRELQVLPAGGLEGLDTALRDADQTLARDALTAILTQLLWLLVTFIGDDLTRRTLRDVWPELKLEGEAPDTSKDSTT